MMKWIQPQTWQHHLACIASATALVCSLSAYKHQVEPQPGQILKQHWSAIASSDAQKTVNLYSNRAILKHSSGIKAKIYQGDSVYAAWQDFFSQYRVKDLQAIQPIHYQDEENTQGVRNITAQIKIRLQSRRGQTATFLANYQVQIDRQGQILREVWQTRPDFPL
jgi:hypothetical protein